jgi:hypothetical protein
MIRFTDRQLQIVMDAAAAIDPDRRSTFLERVAAMLRFRMLDDAAVTEVVGLASALIHHRPDAA